MDECMHPSQLLKPGPRYAIRAGMYVFYIMMRVPRISRIFITSLQTTAMAMQKYKVIGGGNALIKVKVNLIT